MNCPRLRPPNLYIQYDKHYDGSHVPAQQVQPEAFFFLPFFRAGTDAGRSLTFNLIIGSYFPGACWTYSTNAVKLDATHLVLYLLFRMWKVLTN